MMVIGITLYLELAIERGSGESREVDIQGLQVHYVPHMPLVLRGFACTFPAGMKTNIVSELVVVNQPSYTPFKLLNLPLVRLR